MSFLDGFLNERPDQKPEDESKEARQTTSQSGGDPISSDEKQNLQNLAAEKIREIFDPEIPVNIYDLGLIYDVERLHNGDVYVTMSLTAPGCPVAGEMPGQVARALAAVDGVGEVSVELVWSPPWTPERMSDDARLALDF